MPVRDIPRNFRSVTGSIVSDKNRRRIAFESTLERDFFILQEFAPSVLRFEEQPLGIDYALKGELHVYVPDALVEYRELPPTLFEIKYRSGIAQEWPKLRRHFRAASKYAHDNGIRFRIGTEVEIRTGTLALAIHLLLDLTHSLGQRSL